MLSDKWIRQKRRVCTLGVRVIAANGGAVLGLCAVVLLWAGILQSLAIQRGQALRDAALDTSNLAHVVEEQIIRSIKAVDQTLLYVRDTYERDPAGFDLMTWSRHTQALTDFAFQISLIGRDGMMIASNFPVPGGKLDLSDREHFQVHVNNPRDELFISKPVLGRASHQWAIQLTRKMTNRAGGFDGVAVVSLDPGYLSRFYELVDIGQEGAVTIVGTDGVIRARRQAEGSTNAIGVSLADSDLFAHFARAPSGTFTTRSKTDGITRIFTYRTVRGYPLLVSVGLAQDEVLAGYRTNRLWYSALATVVTVLLLAVSTLLVARQIRLDRAREQLRASEAGYAEKSRLLEATLEHMSQGLIMVDGAHRVQVCNTRALEQLGLPRELLATRPLFDDVLRWQSQQTGYTANDEADHQVLRRLVQAGGMSDQPYTSERTRPNGTILEVRSTPLLGGGVVRTYTDITARKAYEADLRAARDEANAGSRAKSEFLATMSHEIRSPMSGMIGVLELLRESELDADQHRMADMVHDSACSLLGVLNDILDFSKIEAGALTIMLEPACLAELLTGLVQTHAFVAARKGLALTLRLDSALPEQAEVDPLRLRQILNNLLANAVKFTPAGAIELCADVVTETSAPMLRFAVTDTGIGMRPDVVARLFQPFMQADGSITRDFGGTGLGLCISRRLAEMLDGTLSASSEAGEGSVFTLLLPLIAARAPDAAHRVDSGPRERNLPAGARVLVTDDDPTNRWLTQRQLELLGLHVEVAENGLIALEMLRSRRYGLMVTDCHMPSMDGVALTRAVRAAADPDLSALPIIGLTADVTQVQRDRCIDAGMSHIAIKPLSKAQLSALVAAYLADPAHAIAPVCDEAPPRAAVTFDPSNYCDMFAPNDAEGAVWLTDYLSGAERLDRDLCLHIAADVIERDAIAATAHRLAGSSFTVGAIRYGEALRALELAAPDADVAAIRSLHALARLEWAAAQTAIAALLSGPTARGAIQSDPHLELAT